ALVVMVSAFVFVVPAKGLDENLYTDLKDSFAEVQNEFETEYPEVSDTVNWLLNERLEYLYKGGNLDALEKRLDWQNSPHLNYFIQRTVFDKKAGETAGIKYEKLRAEREFLEMKETETGTLATVRETVFYVDAWYPNMRQAEGKTYFITVDKNLNICDLTTDDDFDRVMMEKENVDWNQYLPDETDNGERVVSEVSLGDGAEDIADQPNTIGTKYINTSRTVQYADWYATSYNSKFPSYANYGGDCQNFASQCVWYGLGGTDTVAKISSHAVPMVYSGSNAIKWYCGNTYWDYDPLKHWTVVGDFQDMIADSTSGQNGLYGTVWFGYQYASVGDVLQVDFDADGSYDHSYVVVAVEGTDGSRSKSQIWVSCHSPSYSHKKLSDISNSTCVYRSVEVKTMKYTVGEVTSVDEDN
ncbi:MAG: amidase domain-containing protein, partial [Erysipelotrichales bacterium]|nr:amidase domain-containing protein [Erysipelotrichales bacterium]